MAFNEQTAPIEVFKAAARTATVTSSNIDRNSYGRAQTFSVIYSGAVPTGTTPSLTLSIEESDDGSTGWAAIPTARLIGGAFTATNAAAFYERSVRNTKRFLRVVMTISGTTPSFTCAVVALAGDPLDASI